MSQYGLNETALLRLAADRARELRTDWQTANARRLPVPARELRPCRPERSLATQVRLTLGRHLVAAGYRLISGT